MAKNGPQEIASTITSAKPALIFSQKETDIVQEMKKAEPTIQLLLKSRKCNASMTILFHDENGELCVVFQKVTRRDASEWTVSAGKVDVRDQNDIPSVIGDLFKENDIAIFANAAIREALEEQGYPLLRDLELGKAQIYYFDRDANGMRERDQNFRSELFYAYLGERKRDEIANSIRAQGNNDSQEVRIVKISDILIKDLGEDKKEAKIKDEPVSVRISTALMLDKIKVFTPHSLRASHI